MNKKQVYATILYFIFMFAALFSNPILQLVGVILYLLILFILDYKDSFCFIIILSPSVAIVSIPYVGVSLLGIGAFLLCIRKHVFRSMNKNIFIIVSFVFLITVSRIFTGNFYDLILFFLVISVFLLCKYMNDNELLDKKQIIYSFRYGCLLLVVGMIVDYVINGGFQGRFRALSDDCNYTATILYVLFIISLIAFAYDIKFKHNMFYLLLSFSFGAATGSRGFLLTVAISILFFMVRGLWKKEERKISIVAIACLALLIIMYLLNIPFVVKFFDITIGRTLKLGQSYSSGDFMDITSGRMFLWDYYWTNKITSMCDFLFGSGFYQYYLVENGGYGLAAHNIYLSGIIGIGFLGLISMIFLYLSFFSKDSIGYISNSAFLIIPIGVFIEYSLLDGLFDQRISVYMLLAACLACCFSQEQNSIIQSKAQRIRKDKT